MNQPTQQYPPTEHDHTTNAAGPQSALGIPSVGAVARPAALYLTLTDGTVLPVGEVAFRRATPLEHPFREVAVACDAHIAWLVNAAWECWQREQEREPQHEIERVGGAR